jgi:hypothetical protein
MRMEVVGGRRILPTGLLGRWSNNDKEMTL